MLGDTARSLTAGSEVTIALASGGSGEGIIGFEGSGRGGTRRTTTRLLDGEFPKVRSLFPNEHQTTATVDKASLIESLKRVALVAERNTAVQLAFSDGTLTLDAGSRRRGPGQRVDRGDHRRVTTSPPASTRSTSSTACQVIDEAVVELAFTAAPSRLSSVVRWEKVAQAVMERPPRRR